MTTLCPLSIRLSWKLAAKTSLSPAPLTVKGRVLLALWVFVWMFETVAGLVLAIRSMEAAFSGPFFNFLFRLDQLVKKHLFERNVSLFCGLQSFHSFVHEYHAF